MNRIKYRNRKTGEVLVVRVCQPSYERMTLTRTVKTLLIEREETVPLRYPTVAQADRQMLAKGFVR